MPRAAVLFVAVFLALPSGARAAEDRETFTDPALAGPDFAIQGEYTGTVRTDEGDRKFGVQVVALGGGKFHAVGYPGGLPGDGWDKSEKMEAEGALRDGAAAFDAGEGRQAVVRGGAITVTEPGGRVIATLKKVRRESPTLGAKPPAGAAVLFDGASADRFEGGRVTGDGLLMEGATSKQKFGSFTLHLEFRTPFMPSARGQARGNSGFYA